jgi:hypothetical protein
MRYAILITTIVLLTSLSARAQTTQPSASDPSAEQKMNQLLAQPKNFGQPLPPSTQTLPAMDRSTGSAAVAPGAPNLPVVREGTHKIEVAGRLSHSADGTQAIFTFDSDGTTMKDPPMIILPNLKLQSMEGAVAAKASDVHFRVSGTVTEYKGRNYILLDKAVVLADVEKQF